MGKLRKQKVWQREGDHIMMLDYIHLNDIFNLKTAHLYELCWCAFFLFHSFLVIIALKIDYLCYRDEFTVLCQAVLQFFIFLKFNILQYYLDPASSIEFFDLLIKCRLETENPNKTCSTTCSNFQSVELHLQHAKLICI